MLTLETPYRNAGRSTPHTPTPSTHTTFSWSGLDLVLIPGIQNVKRDSLVWHQSIKGHKLSHTHLSYPSSYQHAILRYKETRNPQKTQSHGQEPKLWVEPGTMLYPVVPIDIWVKSNWLSDVPQLFYAPCDVHHVYLCYILSVAPADYCSIIHLH